MKNIPKSEDLTLEEKVGQVLCFGWQTANGEDARTFNVHARALIEEFHVGGLVVMSRNIGTPESTRALLDSMQARSSVPLFVAVDQEGGRSNRFGSPLHSFPGNGALGSIRHGPGSYPPEEYAFRQAEVQACELRAVGVNWDFAPVVDVNNNPDNPGIGPRSYGDDSALVARFGAAAVRGYQGAGLLACAKHFPGHGDTDVDSHLALPIVPHPRERLEAIELRPFAAAIDAGVGSIMTSHILFPALDRENPATVSAAILTNLLRREMGFDGLLITDCLEMQAISDTIGTARGAIQALKAGADMVLVCHTLAVQRDTYRAVLAALESGELPGKRLDEAVTRILEAKRRFLSDPPPVAAAPWLDPAHDALEREIVQAANGIKSDERA